MPCDLPQSDLPDLPALLNSMSVLPSGLSLGADIDEANQVLLDPAINTTRKIQRFRQWASRFQPCMFGRLGARGLAGIHYDMCWIQREEMQQGAALVRDKIQRERLAWKERAAHGLSQGFLVLFNAPELVYARPGPLFLDLCCTLCNLYLIEHAPIAPDTIYTESLPFHEDDGTVVCLKGGINVFYSGAHRTRNHDRRIPGGIMISVNAPGALAHSLVKRGLAGDLPEAVAAVRALAWASIGNGGVSRERRSDQSCSWHNLDASRPAGTCPMKHRPVHVPENFATGHYSALYHTDVLLPSAVMSDPSLDRPRAAGDIWTNLDLEYISAAPLPSEHENHGFVHGERVSGDARFQHRWAPTTTPTPINEEQP